MSVGGTGHEHRTIRLRRTNSEDFLMMTTEQVASLCSLSFAEWLRRAGEVSEWAGCGARSCDLASERDDERATWGLRPGPLAIEKTLEKLALRFNGNRREEK